MAGDPGLDTTKLSLGLQHREISEMFSLLLPHNMKKSFRAGGYVCVSGTHYHKLSQTTGMSLLLRKQMTIMTNC